MLFRSFQVLDILVVFYIIDIMEDLKDNKTEKLVTAIFMVTDLLDKAEPLRNELRSLGIKLLSRNQDSLISQIMSLINIATSIGLVSDMNGGIINKELTNLKGSIPTLESLNFSDVLYKPTVLYKTLGRARPIGEAKSPLSQPKKEVGDRRESILNLIKNKKEVTIKDISSQISDCSEKTIQRELISMLKDKVIQKTGEKRWSKYFI